MAIERPAELAELSAAMDEGLLALTSIEIRMRDDLHVIAQLRADWRRRLHAAQRAPAETQPGMTAKDDGRD